MSLLNTISIGGHERWILYFLFLSLVSVAMAESRLKLSFPDEFYSQALTEKEFDRGIREQKETEDDVREWRSSNDKSKKKARWKSIEFYNAKHKTQPPLKIRERSSTPSIEVNPQFGVSF